MNILIVDDHAGFRGLIRELVRPFATQIRECTSAAEAIKACDTFTPDCITMDLRMNGLDGLTCIEQLRQRLPAAHIAVVTSFDHDQLRTRARFAGADTYILKENLDTLRRYVELLATGLGE